MRHTLVLSAILIVCGLTSASGEELRRQKRFDSEAFMKKLKESLENVQGSGNGYGNNNEPNGNNRGNGEGWPTTNGANNHGGHNGLNNTGVGNGNNNTGGFNGNHNAGSFNGNGNNGGFNGNGNGGNNNGNGNNGSGNGNGNGNGNIIGSKDIINGKDTTKVLTPGLVYNGKKVSHVEVGKRFRNELYSSATLPLSSFLLLFSAIALFLC